MGTRSRRQEAATRAARAASERLFKIHYERALRIQRIQNLYYREFLSRYPLAYLPIPPLVLGGRAEWERSYRAWRDAVVLAVQAARESV